MAPRRKPSETLRRRNRPEEWTVLPRKCTIPAPRWPDGDPTDAELKRFRELYRLPVAAWWAELQIHPSIVAQYVALSLERPEHSQVARLAGELALTPGAMARHRLTVEQPEPIGSGTADDPYQHLYAVT